MTKKLYIGLAILFTISVSIFVFNAIYQGSVPKIVEEINNSSIGAILTAIITVLLLSQQSSSEEVKERNVSVFQKKSEKYEDFIEQIWKVWEDRTITLLELSELLQSFSKDVMLYGKKETIIGVLTSMEEIAKLTSPDKTSNDQATTEKIQSEVFQIIKTLANDLELGGSLDEEAVRTKLFALENRIYPALEEKRITQEFSVFQNNYIEGLKKFIVDSGNSQYRFTNFTYQPTAKNLGLIMIQINDSSLYFCLYNINKKNSKQLFYRLYVPRNLSNYNQYRLKQPFSGCNIDDTQTLKDSTGVFDFDVNFTNYELMKSKIENFDVEDFTNNNKLGFTIVEIVNKITIAGKPLEQIIAECEPKNV